METNIQKTTQPYNPIKKIIIRELLYLIAFLVIVLLSNFVININEQKITDIEKYREEDLIKIFELEEQIKQNEKVTRELYEGLYSQQIYKKTYFEFIREFGNNPESQTKLFNFLSERNLYTKTEKEFKDKFFPLSRVTEKHQLEKLQTSIEELYDVITGYKTTNRNIEYIIIGAIVLLGIRYLFYLIRWIIKNKLFNRVKLSYVLELMIPIFLSLLYFIFIDSTNYSKKTIFLENRKRYYYTEYADIIWLIFSLSFFLITIAEWRRRCKTQKTEHFLIKYIYILIMLLIFLLGIWFINILIQSSR